MYKDSENKYDLSTMTSYMHMSKINVLYIYSCSWYVSNAAATTNNNIHSVYTHQILHGDGSAREVSQTNPTPECKVNGIECCGS